MSCLISGKGPEKEYLIFRYTEIWYVIQKFLNLQFCIQQPAEMDKITVIFSYVIQMR